MFLQWEQLKKCKTSRAARDRLTRLPVDLKEMYDEIYSRGEDHDRVALQRAVRWVMCALEPLSP